MKKLLLLSTAMVASGLSLAQEVGRVVSSTPIIQQIGLESSTAIGQHFGGLEMKTVLGVLSLSIFSALVGVFAATELQEMSMDSDANQPSQKMQQWVNQ